MLRYDTGDQKPVDPTKPVQLSDGKAARLLAVLNSGVLVVILKDTEDGEGMEFSREYYPNGLPVSPYAPALTRLVNVPERTGISGIRED